MSDLKSIRDRYDSILRKEDAAAKSRSQAIEGEAFTQIDMLMSNVSKLKYAPSLDVNGLEEVKKELFKFYELGDKDVSNAVLKHVEEIDKIIGEHPNKVYLTEENAKFMSSPQEFVDSIQEDMKNASDSVMYHCFLDDGSDAGFWMGKYQSAMMKIDAGVKQGKIKLDDQVPGLDVKWKDWKKSISEEQDVYFTKMICSVLSNESGLSFYDDKETKKLAKAAGYKKPHWSAPDGRVVFDSGNANIFNAKGMVFKKRVGNTEITFTGEEVNNEIIPAAKEFLKTYQGKNRREDLVKYLWGDGGVMSKSVTRKLEKGFFSESYKSVLGPIKSIADDELVRWRKMNGRDHERFAIIYAGNQLMSSQYIDNLRKNAEEKNRQRKESKNKESKETK